MYPCLWRCSYLSWYDQSWLFGHLLEFVERFKLLNETKSFCSSDLIQCDHFLNAQLISTRTFSSEYSVKFYCIIVLVTVLWFVISDPPIPHIVQREELQSIIPEPPLEISTEKECFDLWIRVMDLDPYRKSVITGLVSSIGSLTESLVYSPSFIFS